MNSVLVIDDDPDVRDGIARILVRAGFAVRTIAGAADAMLELGRATADVVITDIIMPKMSGVEAIKRIARTFPTVRIIAISGGGNFDATGNQGSAMTTTAHLVAARLAGAHSILTKPFESRELIAAVQQVGQGASHSPSIATRKES
ncbi:MAG: Response regulator receiver domain [Gammaproteobacteria bacterium]|nr:Response regulator receiver domain [Gammaproteobacteria bacterium]